MQRINDAEIIGPSFLGLQHKYFENGLKAGIASLDNILLRFMQERRILRVVKAQIPEALDRMSTWC